MKSNFADSLVTMNARFIHHRVTGVQRYAREVMKRLSGKVLPVAPKRPLKGVAGHLWEQTVLPWATRHTLLWSPCGSGPAFLRRQVVTVHDLAPLIHPEWFNPRFARWYRWLLPRLVHNARRIIAVSEFTRQSILEMFRVPEWKVTVVPNGVRHPTRRPSRQQIGHVLRRLGVPLHGYLVYVGSIEPRKNLARLLRAWEKSMVPKDAWLVVVGATGDPRIFASAQLSTEPKNVLFLGYVSDEELTALYAGALALVYPSLYEGFGLPPLEAMALGTPVLTSNVTALPEVVGSAALLVDPYDVDALADGLRRLVYDEKLRLSLAEKGIIQAKHFTWDRTAKLTWAVLEGVAAECRY